MPHLSPYDHDGSALLPFWFFVLYFHKAEKDIFFALLVINLQNIYDLFQHYPAFQKQHVSSVQETKWSLNQGLTNSSSSFFAKAQIVWGFLFAE